MREQTKTPAMYISSIKNIGESGRILILRFSATLRIKYPWLHMNSAMKSSDNILLLKITETSFLHRLQSSIAKGSPKRAVTVASNRLADAPRAEKAEGYTRKSFEIMELEIKSTISVLLNFVDVSTLSPALFYLCFVNWCLCAVGTFCPSSGIFKGVSFPYRLYKKFAVGVFCTVRKWRKKRYAKRL